MSTTKIESFHIIGLAVKTSNQNGQSAKDIPALWGEFMSKQMVANIPNKISQEVYCIYTNYEGDHTKPYTTLLGCRVSTLENVPEGCKGMTFNAATYEKTTVKGNLMQGLVWNAWTKIWASEMDRTFVADFEIYGDKAHNPEMAEVDIFVGVR